MVETGAWTKLSEEAGIVIEQGAESDEDVAVVEGQVERLKKEFDSLRQETKALVSEFDNIIATTSIDREQTNALDALRDLKVKIESKKVELQLKKKALSEKETGLIKSKVKAEAVELERLHKEEQLDKVLEAVTAAESVDLAFVVDCTRSMTVHIAAVKEKIKGLVEDIRQTNKDLKMRLAMVAYRDIGYKVPLEIYDFDESVLQFVSFVGNLRAGGEHESADRPEDMAVGIQAANTLAWSSSTRVVVIIADNPCHGSQFHFLGDRYPNGTPGIDVIGELTRLSKQHEERETMNIFFGRIQDATDKMISVFEKHVQITSFDISQSDGVADGIRDSVRSSIFRTITASAQVEPFSMQIEKENCFLPMAFRVDPCEPTEEQWLQAKTSKVTMMCNVPIRSISQLEKPVQTGLFAAVGRITAQPNPRKLVDKTPVFLKQAPNPFAAGGSRFAVHGRVALHTSGLTNPKSAVVLKMYKSPSSTRHDLKHYLGQMEVSNVAHFLAKEYNKSMARPKRCAEICVLEARVLESRNKDGKPCWPRFCAEKPLPAGQFTHFSNNTGHWNPSHLDETLLRFSKFTFEITHGFLMVVDLQGIRGESRFYLTDPAIHCTDILRFGSTNLGWGIMERCLKTTSALLAENGWD